MPAGEPPAVAEGGKFYFIAQEAQTMLGDMIGETRGKRVVVRVLSNDPPKVEVSFEDAGKLGGADVKGFGTYTSEVKADGSIHGTGNGVYNSAAGDRVSWTGSGVGKFGPGGAVSYRGMLFYRTPSPNLAKLNNMAGAFEYEVDSAGNTHAKVWEWK